MSDRKFFNDFEAIEMDELVWEWMVRGVEEKTRPLLQKTLLYDRRFREHFCEWIKAIRDPAWAVKAPKDGEDEKA